MMTREEQMRAAMRLRAEAMAEAGCDANGKKFADLDPTTRETLADNSAELAAQIDAYILRTRFVPHWRCARVRRFKPEPID